MKPESGRGKLVENIGLALRIVSAVVKLGQVEAKL